MPVNYKGKNYTVEVKVGTSINDLRAIEVNEEGNPVFLDSPEFTGRMLVRIAEFNGNSPKGSAIPTSPYFKGTQRCLSIQIQGRFKRQWTVDDLMWGNEFQSKLNLPKLTGAALKFIQATIDPSLEAELHSDKPWARSPLIATMNTVRVDKAPDSEPVSPDAPASLPEWPSPNAEHITEDTTLAYEQKAPMDASARRKFFGKEVNRKACKVLPDQVYGFDFYNPILDFANFKVKIPAVHLSVNMMKYYSGEPIRYACKSRDRSVSFFLVQFELMEVKEGAVTHA
eukprot:TRINITY_DN1147_c1_g3_i1.p1 TRINITY_DN1147_c1_g3~~TRINITY_DN1147_c1_g3_i1.p1  ORF type:complete len:284 (+),score=102.28 TRINITY_DN1147_c1_g3_i1:226-1077(+)